LIASCANSSPVDSIETTSDTTVNDAKTVAEPIIVGAERMDEYLPFINQGKRVGIVANQSSMINNTHLVDALMASRF